MEGLCRLVSNNFSFSCEEAPENVVMNINRKEDVTSVEYFVRCCCECREEARESVKDLYGAYRQFTIDNEKEAVSNKRFTQFLTEHYEVYSERTKKCRFYKGIRLAIDDR
jgi:hypothetical protein